MEEGKKVEGLLEEVRDLRNEREHLDPDDIAQQIAITEEIELIRVEIEKLLTG